jgi:GxxExxY protein
MNEIARKMSEPDAHLDELARRVIGAAIAVHRELGPGFLESVYERALCIELDRQRIPYVRQAVFEVGYAGDTVGELRLDLLVDDQLVVELKAVESVAKIHRMIVRSYLKATSKHLALLINFSVPVLKEGISRIVLSQ